MLSREQKQWRTKIFVITWLSYAAFYFCRKNFSVIMPMLSEDLNYTKDDFAQVIATYSFIYMLGQFLSGYLSDKIGPRIVIGVGMIIIFVANFLMGFAGSLGAFLLLMGINGLGQSSGWSGLVKNMAPWFRHEERGVVMSWWTTCYVVGAFLATLFATYWANNTGILPQFGWKRGFWAPSIILLIVALTYILFTRNRPVDIGLPMIVKEENDEQKADFSWKIVAELLSSSALWIAALIYFLLKLTRYAFLFWLPLYMIEALQYENDTAGYISSIYELGGFIGVLFAGYASDRIFQSRRFPISFIMLFFLGLACLIQPTISTISMVFNAIGIGLIGFMTYGPDSILSGATAMDIGGKKGAATAAGFINGVGSAGQLLSPFVVAYVSDIYGWNALFYLFVVLAIIGSGMAALKWNFKK